MKRWPFVSTDSRVAPAPTPQPAGDESVAQNDATRNPADGKPGCYLCGRRPGMVCVDLEGCYG